MTLTVVRDGPVDTVVTVKYKILDGTAKHVARDFMSFTSRTLQFDQGVREMSFNITIFEDDVPEPNEVFYVELYAPTG